jgi:CRP/FNR family transcriptional regulator
VKKAMTDETRNKFERKHQQAPAWIDAFAAFSALDSSSRSALSALPEMKFAKGRRLFGPGAHCAGFVLLLAGRIRVGLTAENGRQLVLYRVVPGETCVQTTLCLLGGLDHSAEGVAESELRLVIAPPVLFQRLLRDSPVFAHFVFERFGARLTEMTKLIETIAFLRVDARLAAALVARAGERGVVAATHQELAEDIGATREGVSRQLALFQRAGLVRLGRGRVALANRRALADFVCVT